MTNPPNPAHTEHDPRRDRRSTADIMSQGTRLSSTPPRAGRWSEPVVNLTFPSNSSRVPPTSSITRTHHDHERHPLMLHRNSIDLLVTAAGATLSTDDELTTHQERLVTDADTLGQILTDAALAASAEPYKWRPVAELPTPTLVDELILQLERTRLAYIDACSQAGDWAHSPAHRCIDRLGTSIRARLDRGTTDPNQMILTSSELEETDPDWRRPTIHAHHDLTDTQEDDHGQP